MYKREIDLYTTEGVPNCTIHTIPFNTKDKLGLSFQRFKKDTCDDVVVIIHGLTSSSDMYIMPEHYNLVKFLHDSGYNDVFCLDFRMSNRFNYNLALHNYNMDDCALHDFPEAMSTLKKITGNRNIHVICHCLGSVSFMMSLFARKVTGIKSVISNSVSLTPRVPGWSKFKLAVSPFLIEKVLGITYLNPGWSEDPFLSRGKIISKITSMFHRECDVPACHMLSLLWGTGWPALYHHENLHEVTHKRGQDLYGGTSMNYHRHILVMVKANNTAVKYRPQNSKYDSLPDNYLEAAEEIETPVLFMTGKDNKVFTDSNIECFKRLEKIVPGRHELHVFEGYGHQDVFMGKNNHVDIFPRLITFLDKHKSKIKRKTVKDALNNPG